MLVTLGFVALVVGVILIIAGYTVEPRAVRPGWAALILAIILIAVGYLLPALTTHDTYDAPAAQALLTQL